MKVKLQVKKRTAQGRKIKDLRSNDIIPLVLYGQNYKPINLEVKQSEFNKVFQKAGMNNIIDLTIEKTKPLKILIQDIQTDPVSDKMIHADLYKIRKDKKLRTEIPLHYKGKSKAVADLEGNLITHKDAIEVEVLPDDLVEEIKVDISPLKTFEDVIKIKDIEIPERMEVLDDPEEIVANVTPPRSEEELEALEEQIEEDIEAVEVEKEKKEEAEEGETEKTEAEASEQQVVQPEEKTEKPAEEAPKQES